MGSCGTVHIDRIGLPPNFRKVQLKKGETATFSKGLLVGIKWMDKRAVTVLSTIHYTSTTPMTRRNHQCSGVETVQKPVMIEQYNKFMGGVDKGYQLVTYYGFYHVSKKWWKRVFFHLLDISLVNAYLLYCSVTPSKQRLSHMDFRLAVASGLIENTDSTPSTVAMQVDAASTPMRLVGRDHFPEPGKTRDCRVCSKRETKRKQTNYQCCTCKVPLCIHPCFRAYHTQKNYK